MTPLGRFVRIAMLSAACATSPALPASGQGEHASPPPSPSAAQAFKNVQALKDVPANEWFGTMAFIAASLGVTCDHCHGAAFEDDVKPAKLKARQMMRMVNDLNARNFGGSVVVTCNTCHRGRVRPEAEPVPDRQSWIATPPTDQGVPDASGLIARYRRAVGLRAPIRPVPQSATLRVVTYHGDGSSIESRIELLVDGQKRIRMTVAQKGPPTTFVTTGNEGWARADARWRPMRPDESADVSARAAILDLDPVGTPPIRRVFRDQVHDRPVYVADVREGSRRFWLYFDASSALLLRKRTFFHSFYGDACVDVEYADYRRVAGLMLPFSITSINAGGEGLTERRVLSRRLNPRISDADFAAQGGTSQGR